VSKTATDCLLCHERPAADQFGWCDECARLYDQPDDQLVDRPDDPEDRLLVDQLLTHLFNATHTGRVWV
jgi:hypothetical protein